MNWKKLDDDYGTLAGWIFGILLMLVLFVVMPAVFEARAYNKFTTGEKATWWDAVCVDLRVTPK